MSGHVSQDLSHCSPEQGTGETSRLPLVEELIPCPDLEQLLQKFTGEEGLLVLDSARHAESLGRYSYLMFNPLKRFQIQQAHFGTDPFEAIRQLHQRLQRPSLPELPPFQGGFAGLLSYELGRSWEQFPRAPHDEFGLPDLAVGFYDWVIAWDHRQHRAWLIVHGFDASLNSQNTDLAAQRLCAIRQRIESVVPRQRSSVVLQSPIEKQLDLSALSASHAVEGLPGILSNFSKDQFLRQIERIIEYIYAGDIFQANFSQRLLSPVNMSPAELYLNLRSRNAAPFAGYFAWDDWAVLSASPERFLNVSGSEVETRPIKGTRRRKTVPEADLLTRDELRESKKDQAENVMIVDLLRNDLSRVCEPGSIRVPHLCEVETYETVQHLVSEVRGKLKPEHSVWDLLSSSFPGGSITGAPKVRAMEIIAELEPTVRGPYCGSLFYAGLNGEFDSNILIRTFTVRQGWVQFPVGGGIVAQSQPRLEYEETLHKAAGMIAALET
ncbi:Aminodeoxychorismate synthase component 1 [Gimesia panareensis]|uniref:aminodeoxychorismate synthase n=1 Tax=Gimesia panareensis TaxID=2527978 RepID=A0A518FKB9_9PLAN|nr:aminodeoxychorismate synthase component I [Gimesia panareensis]QDV16789.1 Aminodeoxychorismate synthase component 1 [Gimesia panareensis]